MAPAWKNLHALPFINYQLISSEPSDSHNDICVSKCHFPWIRDCMNPFDAKLKLKVLWKLPAQTTRYPGLIESEPSYHLLRSSGNISIGKSVSSYRPIRLVAVLKRAPIGPHRLLAVKGWSLLQFQMNVLPPPSRSRDYKIPWIDRKWALSPSVEK
jgi:hypothetical protein